MLYKATQEDLGVKWTSGKRLTYLDFADDIAPQAENEDDLQQLTSRLEEATSKVGLIISSEKTKVMYVSATNSTTPTKDGTQPIKKVEHTESDVNHRIGKAASVFRRMTNI